MLRITGMHHHAWLMTRFTETELPLKVGKKDPVCALPFRALLLEVFLSMGKKSEGNGITSLPNCSAVTETLEFPAVGTPRIKGGQ
jgi:hypothetical protein